MEPEKNIGSIIDVKQAPQVTEALDTHQAPENYMQKYLPQNGGLIQASKEK